MKTKKEEEDISENGRDMKKLRNKEKIKKKTKEKKQQSWKGKACGRKLKKA